MILQPERRKKMNKKTTERPWLKRGEMTIEEACLWLGIENPENRTWTAEELEEAHTANRRAFQAANRHGSYGMAYRALNQAYARIASRMGLN